MLPGPVCRSHNQQECARRHQWVADSSTCLPTKQSLQAAFTV